MTIYYAGIGGNDANAGTSWALRKLTLTATEAVATAAGDVVYVGPGTYREQLTTTQAGSAGNPITWIADESGLFTDGIGGEVRVTGSDNDQTATRAQCITCAHAYRDWIGFHVDTATNIQFGITASNVNVTQCVASGGTGGFQVSSGAITINFKKCMALFSSVVGFNFTHSSTVNSSAIVVENCWAICIPAQGFAITRYGDITFRDCDAFGCGQGIRQVTAPAVGHPNIINNCRIAGCPTGLQATATTDLTEDYNSITAATTARTNVTAGANSNTYPTLTEKPLLTLGLMIWKFGYPASYSQLAAIAGSGVATDDLFGATRPTPASWGAQQYFAGERPRDAGYSAGRRFGGK